MEGTIPLLFVIAVVVVTLVMGVMATRAARSAGDFFVAGRAVNVFWNASARPSVVVSAAQTFSWGWGSSRTRVMVLGIGMAVSCRN